MTPRSHGERTCAEPAPYAAGVAILIDPPRWPAHGTLFSHLVSDVSLAELHAFAERAGIRRRAFDLDHYDVPAERYDALVTLGAEPVTGGALIRRLRASGLRVRTRDRPHGVLTALRARWPVERAVTTAVREELLERWSEPHRRYHDTTHLLAVLEAVETLSAPGPVPPGVALAAWFHDAVYDGAPSDEEASAQLAHDRLAPLLPAGVVAEVVRLVRLTADHRPDVEDLPGTLLCDADLAVLGDEPRRYDRYVERVRQDYAQVSEADWRRGRAAVLQRLLALDPLYRTERGRALWQDTAIANLRRELAALTD